jgi:hypothetical protein
MTTQNLFDLTGRTAIITGGSRLVMQNVKLENVKFLKRLSMIDDADLKQFKKSVK